MQLSSNMPVLFAAKKAAPKTEKPKTEAPTQRFIVMLKDEVFDTLGVKALPELQAGLKKAGFPETVKVAARGLLKILVGSKPEADALKQNLEKTSVPGLAKQPSGTWQFSTALPDEHKSITRAGFPDPFPLPVRFVDKQNMDIIYR